MNHNLRFKDNNIFLERESTVQQLYQRTNLSDVDCIHFENMKI